VIRLVVSGKPILLLPGDLDHVGLENLEATGTQMSSRVLVFPHHGGRPGGGNAGEFAKKLTRLVSPELVVFSNGRGKHNNPNPVIVDGVRQAAPSAVVACTQLSEVCAKDIPNPLPHPVSSYYSAGHGRGYSCAGSIELRCNPSAELFPLVRDHGAFVTKNAPTALCRLPLPDVRGQARTATPRKRT
jgi:competence protein ComEC